MTRSQHKLFYTVPVAAITDTIEAIGQQTPPTRFADISVVPALIGLRWFVSFCKLEPDQIDTIRKVLKQTYGKNKFDVVDHFAADLAGRLQRPLETVSEWPTAMADAAVAIKKELKTPAELASALRAFEAVAVSIDPNYTEDFDFLRFADRLTMLAQAAEASKSPWHVSDMQLLKGAYHSTLEQPATASDKKPWSEIFGKMVLNRDMSNIAFLDIVEGAGQGDIEAEGAAELAQKIETEAAHRQQLGHRKVMLALQVLRGTSIKTPPAAVIAATQGGNTNGTGQQAGAGD